MAVMNQHKPEIRWDQTAFEACKATLSPARIAEDDELLESIFVLAADSPLLLEELEWAERHGIKFSVDRTAVNCGGFYTRGAGVVTIAAKTITINSKGFMVEAIAHELRHAWQDYHGFLNNRSISFEKTFIQQALFEADASAFGKLACHQYLVAESKRNNQRRASWKTDNDALAACFMEWFSTKNFTGTGQTHTEFYGDSTSKHFGQYFNLFPVEKTKPDQGLPERRFEFNLPEVLRGNGINIDNINDVLQLGVNFSGTGNYLTKLPPNILPRKILRPSQADTFWGAANSEQRKFTTELRKAYLKEKLAPQNRKKHHPWP